MDAPRGSPPPPYPDSFHIMDINQLRLTQPLPASAKFLLSSPGSPLFRGGKTGAHRGKGTWSRSHSELETPPRPGFCLLLWVGSLGVGVGGGLLGHPLPAREWGQAGSIPFQKLELPAKHT